MPLFKSLLLIVTVLLAHTMRVISTENEKQLVVLKAHGTRHEQSCVCVRHKKKSYKQFSRREFQHTHLFINAMTL